MEDVKDVIRKIQAARAAHKSTLKGIDLMQWNLYEKLRGWMMRNDNERCVTVGEVADKVKQYAPKSILKSKDEFIKAIENLWRITHCYSISSDDFLQEDLEFELSFIFKN